MKTEMTSTSGEEEVIASTLSGPSETPTLSHPKRTMDSGAEEPLSIESPSTSTTQSTQRSQQHPQQQQPQRETVSNYPPQMHPQGQYHPSQHSGSPNPYVLSSMANALPEHSGSPGGQQFQAQYQQNNPRVLGGGSTPGVVYQLQQNLQYPHQGSPGYTNPGTYGPYVQQYTGHSQSPVHQASVYGSYVPSNQQRQAPMQHPGSPYQQGQMQYYYYQDPYGRHAGNPQQYIPQNTQYGNPYQQQQPGDPQLGRPSSLADSNVLQQFPGGVGCNVAPGAMSSQTEENSLSRSSQELQPASAAIPRGPPRKPKQSGHALWVGNLPPGATVLDLKDHFSRDATKDIESLFLISKSNCAFVNYRTEATCAAAMQRFHESRFQGVRLVCRLRRSSTQPSAVPTGPSSMTSRRTPEISPPKSPMLDGTEDEEEVDDEEEEQDGDMAQQPIPASPTKQTDRYFIVKSLTLQDVEQSVRNSVWATQAHNEEVLNNAYQSAENVYLIFSANKSGEYFGYARMASSISENAEAIFGTIPRSDLTESTDAPKSIMTPATEFAPKGRVIDDSARGTIFWEAEYSDDDEENDQPAEIVENLDGETGSQTWGRPFKVEWMSTTRLPFYRTRGLRNPWNSNREVKIARDGTEIEPGVGKRLVQLFHRAGQPLSTTSSTVGPSHTVTTGAGAG